MRDAKDVSMHDAAPVPHPDYPLTLGANPLDDGRCSFQVWAPKADRIELVIHPPEASRKLPASGTLRESQRVVPLELGEDAVYRALVEDVPPGARYFYRLDGQRLRPDPASRFQPEGVHGPSEVVDPSFDWKDDGWHGLALKDYITYELHVGTFTSQGTFDAVIARLDELRDLGVTAIELMPVAQFPGERNWGYDGVQPFAVQNSYGGPQGLRRLVCAAHRTGLAVVLDVVYNHIGPEGNYLGEFGCYFTDRYGTPWGRAINYDGPHSDEVRRFFIENALYWIEEFHVDALRLDAVHAIYDSSARPFLQELAEAVSVQGERLGRRVHTIAESNLNDARLIRAEEVGGYGLDAQWADDFHHALHTALTGERSGYYQDFEGTGDVVTALREGFIYSGQRSKYRDRRHGNSARDIPPERFVVCAQNHDQVGNRMLGERLTSLVSFEQLKLAAGVVLLAPYQPLLFMGEEYGETAPFLYFVSHTDAGLIEAVRSGRKEEFASFRWKGEPPDPQEPATFERCRLNHQLKAQPRHAALRELYKTLIRLRRSEPALAFPARERCETRCLGRERAFSLHRWATGNHLFAVFHFGEAAAQLCVPVPQGRWRTVLDSSDERWHGPGGNAPQRIESSGRAELSLSPGSFVLFKRGGEF